MAGKRVLFVTTCGMGSSCADHIEVLKAHYELTGPVDLELPRWQRLWYLLTTAHPVYAGEWVDAGNGAEGMLVYDYFRPPDDVRAADEGHEGARAVAHPLSQVAAWILDAGLRIDRLIEPEPLPIPLLREEEIRARVPYESEEWRGLYPVLSAVPVVAVFRAWKAGPGDPAP